MHIEHIGIAVKDLDAAVRKYEALLGVRARFEKLPDMDIAILEIGGSKLELLYNGAPDSAVGKFLEKRGEGIHHIAFGTDDVQECLNKASELSISLIDKEPRPGADNKMIAFLHPKDTNGVLLEFCMDKK